MCAGIPKGKSSNITSVDGFEGVERLKVPISIELYTPHLTAVANARIL